MSRYIDADAFEYELKEIEAITAMVDKNLGEDEEVGEISMPMFTIRNIMRQCAPIDIVRCGECKHWNEEDHWCNIRDSYGWDYKPDDYCSYGEREGE